jgi:5'(3')-deoxyribonucleotidase
MLGYLILQYNYKYNKNITMNDITEYSLEPFIGKEGIQIFCESGFFNNLKPFPNAVEVLERLSHKHEIFIITHPMNGVCAMDKFTSFNKELSFIPYKNIIMTSRKELINVDLLFDDCPEYLEKCSDKMITVVMDRLYNKNVDANYRIWRNDWLGFGYLIESLCKPKTFSFTTSASS